MDRALTVLAAAFIAIYGYQYYQSSKNPVGDQQTVVAQLKKQADDWDKAIVRKDRAAIAANMAEDFRHIDHEGNISDKAAFLDNIMSPKLRIDPYPVDELSVRFYGDRNSVAALSGRTRMTGGWDGKEFKAHYRYIDIYAKNKGKWQVVSVQISPMPN